MGRDDGTDWYESGAEYLLAAARVKTGLARASAAGSPSYRAGIPPCAVTVEGLTITFIEFSDCDARAFKLKTENSMHTSSVKGFLLI